MVTIKDVAVRAGVSIKTVSRVINGSSEVTDATRQRVQRAASELGYHSNAAARRLVTGRATAVGVVIPKSATYVFSHLYFNEILRGVGEVLDRHGFEMLLHLGRESKPYADLIREQQVDGLILLAIPTDDPHIADLLESDLPCVFTCRVSADDDLTSWIESDAAGGIRQAIDHLASLGHTRLGMLAGPPTSMLAREQLSAFREGTAAKALERVEASIRQTDYTVELGEQAARSLLQSPEAPTALVCADDMIAIGAIRAATSLGLRVPDDVSVTGFDDIVLARYTTPALTTVRQDGYRKGGLAAEHLIERLGGPGDRPWQQRLETELIVRDTTGPPNRSVA